jgi:glutathione S-transferase
MLARMPILHMGNKNYSSWSIRPWFFLTEAAIPFEARVLYMDEASFGADVAKVSPSRRVPALELEDGDIVWDTLAIGETLAELHPEAGVWPSDPHARRRARSACAEMHSSFGEMRRVLTCNARRRYPAEAWRKFAGGADGEAGVVADLARLHELWTTLLETNGGPFLGGARFGWVDAFFAPVVSRLKTYAIESPASAAAYRARIEALGAWKRWMSEAEAETHVIAKYEYG